MTALRMTDDLLKAAKKALRRLPKARAQAPRPPDRLGRREAIRIWCRVMDDWPESRDINSSSSLSSAVRDLKEKFFPSPQWSAVQEVKEELKRANPHDPMNIDDALLGGLAAALIALSGYWLARRLRHDGSNEDGSSSATSEHPSEPSASERTVAVLAINATHGTHALNRLEEGPLKAVAADDLYQATDHLWQASRHEYKTTDLSKYFGQRSPERSAPPETEHSEYDIRLVRVMLPHALLGLRRGASRTDRYDAFETLVSEGGEARVSSRLPLSTSDLSRFHKR